MRSKVGRVEGQHIQDDKCAFVDVDREICWCNWKSAIGVANERRCRVTRVVELRKADGGDGEIFYIW